MKREVHFDTTIMTACLRDDPNQIVTIKSFPGKDVPEECVVLQRLTHRNIINVIDCIQDDHNFFMVMPSVAGEVDLYEYMHMNDLDLSLNHDLIFTILKQLCDALEYLHSEHHLAHCDIKVQGYHHHVNTNVGGEYYRRSENAENKTDRLWIGQAFR